MCIFFFKDNFFLYWKAYNGLGRITEILDVISTAR